VLQARLRGAKAQTHKPDADNTDAGSDCVELCLFPRIYIISCEGGFFMQDFHKSGNEQAKHPDIIGCQYQISVLRDNFVPMILDALGKVDTGKVWAKTAKTSTVYRGRMPHVVDCVKACFSHIYDGSLPYITMTATFFKNGFDDINKDCFIAGDLVLLNDTQKTFNVLGRISLFSPGLNSYNGQSDIAAQFAHKRNIGVSEGHYANDYEGNVHDMFGLINDIMEYGNKHLDNYALSVSMTIYGPEAIKPRGGELI